MTLLDFVYVSLATYYLATAFVDIASHIRSQHVMKEAANATKDGPPRWSKWVQKKPFNCVLCMAFYFSILLIVLFQFVSIVFIIIPAIAGVALLLSKIQQKLETFTID